MKTLKTKPSKHGHGEIWFGIPTWDPAGQTGTRSVKFAYRTKNQAKWARTSPEVPEDIVGEMFVMLKDEGHLGEALKNVPTKALESLVEEMKLRLKKRKG